MTTSSSPYQAHGIGWLHILAAQDHSRLACHCNILTKASSFYNKKCPKLGDKLHDHTNLVVPFSCVHPKAAISRVPTHCTRHITSIIANPYNSTLSLVSLSPCETSWKRRLIVLIKATYIPSGWNWQDKNVGVSGSETFSVFFSLLAFYSFLHLSLDVFTWSLFFYLTL